MDSVIRRSVAAIAAEAAPTRALCEIGKRGLGRPRDNGRMQTLRIATRKSPLALWQSEHVADRLRAAHPGLEVTLVPLSTRGDEILDRSLAAIGGKGLFLKELEIAMLRGEADCAVPPTATCRRCCATASSRWKSAAAACRACAKPSSISRNRL